MLNDLKRRRLWTSALIICSVSIVLILQRLIKINFSATSTSWRLLGFWKPTVNSITVLTVYLENRLKRTVWINNIVVVSGTVHSVTKRTLIISLLIELIVNSSNGLVSFVTWVIKRFYLIELLLLF